MNIQATTQICGIIGDPVDHSLSPQIHNVAFHELGLDFAYLAFPVKNVEAAVKGIRALNIRGVNVTVPHKQAVMPYLDTIEREALAIGAVNTIINEKGRLKGYNTDAPGFIAALQKVAGDTKGKRVMVLGAGGAARAVVYSLMHAGAQVTVLNRTLAHAQSLVKDVGGTAGELNTLSAAVTKADVIVNATSIGLYNTSESPISKDLLHKGLTVFDIVYDKEGTQLIRDAEAADCVTIPGTEMLLEQAVFAFKLFTGYDAPIEMMREALLEVTS